MFVCNGALIARKIEPFQAPRLVSNSQVLLFPKKSIITNGVNAGVSGWIDGAGGTNTLSYTQLLTELSYAGYGGDVVVNLELGTAIAVLGRVSNIQVVIGGGGGADPAESLSVVSGRNAYARVFDYSGTGDTSNPASYVEVAIGPTAASGLVPEHTLKSYETAILQGADFIEPDLVSTKDGVLVARHENALASVNPTTGAVIEATTNVHTLPQFADRTKTKVIDGVSVTGWFTEDFTLAELKTLRARERLPAPRGTAFDDLYQIPTFAEVIELAQRYSVQLGRTVGVYPETKHPTYFDGIGLSLEEPLVATLEHYGLDRPDSPVFIQSFEVSNLRDLNAMIDVPLVQLIDAAGKPYDFVVSNDSRTYADLARPAGLAEIATYADGIGANKRLIIPQAPNNGPTLPATTLVDDAHAAGLLVHAWTFRNEDTFLAPNYNGDPRTEYEDFFRLGIDGLFSDFPGTAYSIAHERFPYIEADHLRGLGLLEQ